MGFEAEIFMARCPSSHPTNSVKAQVCVRIALVKGNSSAQQWTQDDLIFLLKVVVVDYNSPHFTS